jgi:hypothetical protein
MGKGVSSTWMKRPFVLKATRFSISTFVPNVTCPLFSLLKYGVFQAGKG